MSVLVLVLVLSVCLLSWRYQGHWWTVAWWGLLAFANAVLFFTASEDHEIYGVVFVGCAFALSEAWIYLQKAQSDTHE